MSILLGGGGRREGAEKEKEKLETLLHEIIIHSLNLLHSPLDSVDPRRPTGSRHKCMNLNL